MEELPFTPYGFTLYDDNQINALISASLFKIIAVEHQTEKIKRKTAELVSRTFTTVITEKESDNRKRISSNKRLKKTLLKIFRSVFLSHWLGIKSS